MSSQTASIAPTVTVSTHWFYVLSSRIQILPLQLRHAALRLLVELISLQLLELEALLFGLQTLLLFKISLSLQLRGLLLAASVLPLRSQSRLLRSILLLLASLLILPKLVDRFGVDRGRSRRWWG